MFHFIRLFLSNIKINSALKEAGYNPKFFFSDPGYIPISSLVAYKKMNQYEAATSLIAILDDTLHTEHADNTLKSWDETKKINPFKVKFAIKLRLYKIIKSRGEFDGSFQDFCKQYPGFGDI